MNVTQQIADKAVGAPIPTRKGTELGKASIKIIVIIALAAFVTLMILSRTQDERTEKIVQAQASGPQSPFEEVHAQTEAARGGKPTGPSLTPDYEETSMIVEQVALGLLALLTIGLCAHRFAPVIAESLNTRFNPWVPQLAGVDRSLTAGMDAQRLAQFAAALKATARPAQEDTVPWSSSNSQAQTSAPTPLDAKFFEIAAEKLEVIRKLFIQASGASEQDAQLKIVAELNNKLRSFSMVCEASELAPARQLAMGVEGLLKQAAEKYEYLTASVLRTGANAIVLLQKLCQPGNNRVLTKDHQPRFLVVDDDPISRHAVSSALKKVFSQPDAAENGE